ncbi:MAG: PilZ domain-containing protein [Oligoflexales bacterium]
MNSNDSKKISPRQERIISHALVEVRKYRFLPFSCYSAVLLDISLNGFKLEFTSEVTLSPSRQYWLSIPLSPLGIYAPKKLLCKCECRWFDGKRYRIGGVFLNLTKTQKMIVEQAIESLKSRKSI